MDGNDIAPASELYVKNFGMDGKQTWSKGNFQMAWGILGNEGYAPEAKNAFLSALKKNPKMLQEYLSMKNPGFMLRNMREWMKSAGYEPGQGQLGTSNSEGQVAGQTSGENTGIQGYGGSDTGQTDEDFETARTNAYRDGWGEEFEKQAREGSKSPQRPG